MIYCVRHLFELNIIERISLFLVYNYTGITLYAIPPEIL